MKKLIAVLAALSVIITVAVPVTAATKPTAVKLTAVKNTATGVLLKWKASKSASKYYVYRKTPKIKYKKIATVKSTSFTHKSAVSGNKYTYKIYAVNSKGMSKASNQKTILRVGTPSLSSTNTASAINVSWSKTKKATLYVLLYKKASAKSYKVLYRGTKNSYVYDNLALGTKYNFKVRANINKARGAYSAVNSQLFLSKPTLGAQEPESMKGINLDWSPITNAKGYIIYRSLKSENSYKRIKKLTTNTTRYLDTEVKSINTYKYYVRAYNGAYKSAKSNVATEIYGYFESTSVPLTLTIKKDETYKDIYNKLAYYGATVFVTWKSLNPNIAKVDSNGVIQGVKKGSATLKATVDPDAFALVGHDEIKEAKTITFIVTVK